MKTSDIVAAIRRQRVVAIVRTDSADSAYAKVMTLVEAGVAAVEVSLVTPGALGVIARVADGSRPESAIGVGTALSAADVRAAVDAGAQFVVAPTFRPDVVAASRALGVPVVPGVQTPTEAMAAFDAGADLVKIFPASTWSPRGVRDLLTALPQLPLVPTGGVGLDDAPDWIAAGAVAVGIGGALTRGDAADVPNRVADLLRRLEASR